MAKLQIKYRLEGKALPPRPIKVDVPGWGGSPDFKKVNGSQPQPWHCPLHVEGCTHGVELLYQYDNECHVINDRGHIRIQFFGEALLLALLGGGAGILIGWLTTVGYAAIEGWPVDIPFWAAAGGMGATLLVGGVAGLYPALRAARLNPTEALASA